MAERRRSQSTANGATATWAPFGHGLWTAVLGGVLFRGAREVRPHLSWGLVGTYLLVAFLHAVWDFATTVGAVGLLAFPVVAGVGVLALWAVWRRRPAGSSYGVRSDDGRWRWDGQSWQPLPQQPQSTLYGRCSQDGRWWWDGRRWQPVPAAT